MKTGIAEVIEVNEIGEGEKKMGLDIEDQEWKLIYLVVNSVRE